MYLKISSMVILQVTDFRIRVHCLKFLSFQTKHVVGSHKKHLNETIF